MKTLSKDVKQQGLKLSTDKLSWKIWFLNEIWAGEVVDEPYGVTAEEAVGHHRYGGQPRKTLARRDVPTMDLFQGQTAHK